MKVYLVGGAVRDTLLGLAVKERDWVVVGSTPDEMLSQGFQQVGKDFPVFLHPKTHEEYALARTERKVSAGYTGFTCCADPSVTLEEDLARRDLTINAIAQDDQGHLIDPFNGAEDCKAGVFRHVSDAFVEDPVRILRLARFAARFPQFTVAQDTLVLAQKMVEQGECDALVAERVWKECSRAMQAHAPVRFFEVLFAANALDVIFSPLSLTSKDWSLLPSLKSGHDSFTPWSLLCVRQTQVSLKQWHKRFRVPTDMMAAITLVNQHHSLYASITHLPAKESLALMRTTDRLRRPHQLDQFLNACAYLYPEVDRAFVQRRIERLDHAMVQVDIKHLIEKGFKGAQLAKQIEQERLYHMKQVCGE